MKPDWVPGPGQYTKEGIGGKKSGGGNATFRSVTERDLGFIRDKSKFHLLIAFRYSRRRQNQS